MFCFLFFFCSNNAVLIPQSPLTLYFPNNPYLVFTTIIFTVIAVIIRYGEVLIFDALLKMVGDNVAEEDGLGSVVDKPPVNRKRKSNDDTDDDDKVIFIKHAYANTSSDHPIHPIATVEEII